MILRKKGAVIAVAKRDGGLLILIRVFELIAQGKKLSERLHPILFEFAGVEEFAVGFEPVEVVMLFNTMTGRIAMVPLDKVHHVLISFLPPFVLGHLRSIYLSTTICTFDEGMSQDLILITKSLQAKPALSER